MVEFIIYQLNRVIVHYIVDLGVHCLPAYKNTAFAMRSNLTTILKPFRKEIG